MSLIRKFTPGVFLIMLCTSCVEIKTIAFYKSGEVKRIIFNKPQSGMGQTILLYKSGVVKATIPNLNGKHHGITKIFYKNGKMKELIHFKNGQLEGQRKSFYRDGTLQSISNYSGGTIQGVEKNYYPDGIIQSVWHYEGDVYVGEEYYTSGEVKFKFRYSGFKILLIQGFQKNGNYLTADVIIYYPSGKKEVKGTFHQGIPDGKLIRYFETGSISSIGYFRKGVPVGTHQMYDEDGTIIFEIPYIDGKLNGVLKVRHDLYPEMIFKMKYINDNQVREWSEPTS